MALTASEKFRRSLDTSRLATDRINSLPKDYEDTHPAEHEVEMDLMCKATSEADRASPTTWAEFAELLDHMSYGGALSIDQDNAERLRDHAHRLLSAHTNGDC